MSEIKKTEPPIHPGPSKDVWDEALVRSGIDPAGIVEYNTHNSPAGDRSENKQKPN